MRKQIVVAIALATTLVMTGCSSGSSSQPSSQSQQSASEPSQTSTLFVADEWPDSPFLETVPAPAFSSSPSSISTSEYGVKIGYEGLDPSEVEAYVQQVKDAGFTHDANETREKTLYFYAARDKDDIKGSTHISIEFRAATDDSPTLLQISVSAW